MTNQENPSEELSIVFVHFLLRDPFIRGPLSLPESAGCLSVVQNPILLDREFSTIREERLEDSFKS